MDTLGLSGCNSDDLSSDEAERGGSQNAPVSQEASLGPVNTQILHERSRLLPVAETNSVVAGTSAKVKNHAEYDEADEGQDFDLCRRRDVLVWGFSSKEK